MKKNLITAILMTVVTTVLLGIIYPLVVTALAQTLFHDKANGQLIHRNGVTVASRIIGQPFVGPGYFHSRPSAAGNGYDAGASSGSNLGPTNQKLLDRVKADTDRLQEQSLAEQAAAEKPAEGFTVADVAMPEFAGTARAAALDLSLVDGRFAPDLLAAEVKRAVAAWAGAVDGDRAELAELTSPAALRELLHPGDPAEQTRLVVRGPQVRDLRILALDAQKTPAEMTVELEVHGCRYIEDRDTTAVVSGSADTPSVFREHWSLTLDGDDAHPWRIVSAA